jgi:hypothetical protein
MTPYCTDGLRDQLEGLVGSFVVTGEKQSDVYDAIVEEIGNLRTSHASDPDPAKDRPGSEAEEPSIEWPGDLP